MWTSRRSRPTTLYSTVYPVMGDPRTCEGWRVGGGEGGSVTVRITGIQKRLWVCEIIDHNMTHNAWAGWCEGVRERRTYIMYMQAYSIRNFECY